YPYRKMINAQTNALIQGIEWSATYKMTPQLTWMATAEVLQGRDTTNDRELPLMPANNATLSAQYTFASRGYLHQPYVGVGTKYAAPKDSAGAYEPFSQFDNTPFGTASTQDYWLWHLEAGTGFKFGKQRLSVDLTVQNLMDVAYRDFLDTYKGYAQGMGRNFRLSARMPFGD
ncbi:MAG: TonB-dependent receptor, partial [Hydrogenovibrio sp.]